jgi:hypothetical protein
MAHQLQRFYHGWRATKARFVGRFRGLPPMRE